MTRSQVRHAAGAVLGLCLLALALWVLRSELKEYDKILEELRRLAACHGALAWALAMTVLAYLVLTGYDLLAMVWIGHRLGVGRTAFTAFLAYVFSNNIGMSVVGASAIRLRMYPRWGLSVMEVVKIVAFVAFTFWLGLLNIAGLTFLVQPIQLPHGWQRWLPWFETARPIGVLLLGVILVYILLCWRYRRPLRIFRRELPIPSARIAVAQVAVGSVDWALAGAIFYVLLHTLSPEVPMGAVMVAYFLAVVLGQASHSPGGLGVFELLLERMLSPFSVSNQKVLAAALGYRLIYLILPLLVGIVCLGGHELVQLHRLLFGRRRT